MEQKFFKLQEGEKVVKEIKPLPALKWYFLIKEHGILLVGIPIFLFYIFHTLFLPIFSLFPIFSLVVIILTSGLALSFVIVFLIAYLRYKHQYYWITNKRVIYKEGLIGYKVTSIPLERISDVIISRTFFERIFGFGSILIQSLAGQVSGGRLGAEASLLAVPNPEETQELIFELVKRKRKEEEITM